MTDDQQKELPPDDMIDPPKVEPPPPPQPNGNGSHPETINESVRKARELIPVGDRGVTPQTYAQWIDLAKDLCKATLILPAHLHHNAPVMAALLEIASRFQLSPYMLASKTYVQNGRLCFESQAFGAILYASGLLLGRLRYEFHGEGEDMTCTVSGRFKDDPETVHPATTPPLRLIHPGSVNKDGKTFVKGSPLWDKDPEQQLAYFAQRRWIRRYAPDCAAGMYTREEVIELDNYRAESAGAITLTSDRLGKLETGEGWGDGSHIENDLAAIRPELPDDPLDDAPAKPQKKPAKGKKQVVRLKGAAAKETQPAKPAKRAEPKWRDYVTRAEDWVRAETDPEAGMARWETERDERDRLTVPMGERSRLRALLDRKVAGLQPPKEMKAE